MNRIHRKLPMLAALYISDKDNAGLLDVSVRSGDNNYITAHSQSAFCITCGEGIRH